MIKYLYLSNLVLFFFQSRSKTEYETLNPKMKFSFQHQRVTEVECLGGRKKNIFYSLSLTFSSIESYYLS